MKSPYLPSMVAKHHYNSIIRMVQSFQLVQDLSDVVVLICHCSIISASINTRSSVVYSAIERGCFWHSMNISGPMPSGIWHPYWCEHVVSERILASWRSWQNVEESFRCYPRNMWLVKTYNQYISLADG